ncbi:MAG: hypothetical protein VYB15_09280, partial [Planctomycetota bacterium]|nr:hypothetical protein [Planctomycetota bacterium]
SPAGQGPRFYHKDRAVSAELSGPISGVLKTPVEPLSFFFTRRVKKKKERRESTLKGHMKPMNPQEGNTGEKKYVPLT